MEFPAEDREARIAAVLWEHELAALLALTPENAAWLSGRTSLIATLWRVPGLIAVAAGPDGAVAVAAGDNEIAAYPAPRFARFPFALWIEHLDLRPVPAGELRQRIAAARAEAIDRPAQYDLDEVHAAIVAAVRAVAPEGGRVGVDLALVPASTLTALREGLAGFAVVDATALFHDLRAVKDAAEIGHLRHAAALTEIGIAAVRDTLRPGLSTTAVLAAYQTAVWQHASADARFAALRQVEGLVTVGDGSPGPGVVTAGETVKLDMQVDVGGYHSDIGRTYALTPTADQREVFTALRDALTVLVAAAKPGVRFRDLHAAGSAAMREAGFPTYSRGHLGHSVGLAHNFEEPPFVAADEPRPLAPGMVLSLELPYYLLGVGSFQLERMVLITADGNEPLDRLPLELAVGSI